MELIPLIRAACAVLALVAPASAAPTPVAPGAPRAARAPGGGDEVKPPAIRIAVVNGRELTFDVAYETFLASHTGHGVLVRGAEAVRDLAARLVERELFLMEAETLGVSEERDVKDVIESYHFQVAADEYWKREVQDKATVTDAEVEAFYEKTDVALGLTLIVTEKREEAEALRARVQAGEDMRVLARGSSIHESRNFDGALALVRRGELFRTLEGPAFALSEPGSLTEVVETDKGFAFARLDQRSINADRPPKELAIPQIRGILIERLQKKLAAEVDARVLARPDISVDEALLGRENVLDGKDDQVIVARAGEHTLSLAELREGLDLEKLRAAESGAGADAGIKLARQWARGRALLLAAKESGVFDAPEVSRRVLSFRRDVIMKTLCDHYVWPDTDPSERDVRRYYDEHLASEFTNPLEVRLAYIVLATMDEGRAIRARLDAGEDFEKLAREHSKDAASAMHGGRIGWVKPGELLPAVEIVLQKLAKGGIEGPIETTEGAFVVRVLDRKEPRAVPYEIARATAERSLVKLRRQEAYGTWAKALRERAEVELDAQGVEEAVRWLDAEAARRAAESAKNKKSEAGDKPPGHDAAAAPPRVLPGPPKSGPEKPGTEHPGPGAPAPEQPRREDGR